MRCKKAKQIIIHSVPICPVCEEILEDTSNGEILTSNPPQKRFTCKTCKITYNITEKDWPKIEYEDKQVEPTIVLVTKGKRESVDYAMIKLFYNKKEALEFIKNTNDIGKKYWTKAEVMFDGAESELVDGYHDYE